jgi:hypothetical protein
MVSMIQNFEEGDTHAGWDGKGRLCAVGVWAGQREICHEEIIVVLLVSDADV